MLSADAPRSILLSTIHEPFPSRRVIDTGRHGSTRDRDRSSGGLLGLLAFLLLRRGGHRLGSGVALGARRSRRGSDLDGLGRWRFLVAALALLDARRLARQIAQVVQPRLVHAAARDHLDL